MTEQAQKEIYKDIEYLEDRVRKGIVSDSTPLAILLLCKIFMEYIKIEMGQHGQA